MEDRHHNLDPSLPAATPALEQPLPPEQPFLAKDSYISEAVPTDIPVQQAHSGYFAQGMEDEADCLTDDDFDSRYIWDEYRKVLYEAVPEEKRPRAGFDKWLAVGLFALALIFAVAGWLRGGKLLLPAGSTSQSILAPEQVQGSQVQQEEQQTGSEADNGQVEEAPIGEQYIATAIVIGGKSKGILASEEAAYALVEEVKAYFGELVSEKGEGEVSVELMEEVTFRRAEPDEEVESFEALFDKFIGADSPLKVKCTLTTEEREEIGYKTTEEKDKYLLEGTRIVVSDGRPGAKVTITHTVYINGKKSTSRSGSETQTIKAQDRLIRVGTQAIDPNAQPGKREGKQGPDTQLVFQSPMQAFTISANYGQLKGVLHLGLDYVPKEGASPDVLASCGGTVAAVMERGGYGLMIEIDHGEGFTTRYAHLASSAVSVGDTVTAGQVIGTAGQSGNAENVHLHFELRVKGEAYNPRFYLD